jgi:hypothetical protein
MRRREKECGNGRESGEKKRERFGKGRLLGGMMIDKGSWEGKRRKFGGSFGSN